MITLTRDHANPNTQYIYRKGVIIGEIRYENGYYQAEPKGGEVREMVTEGGAIMVVANFKREEQLA